MTLSGATGSNSASVNGIYVLAEERLNGKPVYVKRGDVDRWLLYTTEKKWAVSSSLDAGSKASYYAYSEVGVAHPASAKSWHMKTGNYTSTFEPQRLELTIMVSRSSCVRV